MKIIKFFLACLGLLAVKTAYAANEIGLDASKFKNGVVISKDPGSDLAKVFKNFLNILFVVGAMGFIVMFVWGAVDWILSGGDKEKIAGARKRIVTAITGLVLLSLSYVITVVIGQILNIEFLKTGVFIVPTLYNP